MDVSEVLVDYLHDIRHLSQGTRQQYQYHLTEFAQWTAQEGIHLEQVNNRVVQSFLEWVRATHKPHKNGKEALSTRTLVGYVQSLKAFLNWCFNDEEYGDLVTLKTIKRLKMPKSEQFLKEVFTDEELAALFEACKDHSKPHEYQLRDMAIVAVLIDTGVRASELRTLQIGHVFLARDAKEDSYLKVMGKGRKEREIPLGNRARRALNRYIRQYRKNTKKTDPVFWSRQGGPLAPVSLKDILVRLRDLAGLPEDLDVNLHKFRHSYASRFIANGGDIYDLSRLMGHSSVAVTEHYLKTIGTTAVRKRKDRRSVLDEL